MRRCEVQVPVWPFYQPSHPFPMPFLGSMDFQFRGNLLVNMIEELAKFAGTMPPKTFAHHLAGSDVEGGEKGGRSMAQIIGSATFRLGAAHQAVRPPVFLGSVFANGPPSVQGHGAYGIPPDCFGLGRTPERCAPAMTRPAHCGHAGSVVPTTIALLR